MDELVKRIATELNISEDKARTAIKMTAEYLHSKLPDFLNDEVEAVLITRKVEDILAREVGLFKVP